MNMGEILEREYYNEIDTTAKTLLVGNIIYDMESLTDGRQLNMLNKTLNHILEDYDIIGDDKPVEIENWGEYNKELINKIPINLIDIITIIAINITNILSIICIFIPLLLASV